jgi:tetratricopeptide (TPR) repeat protein
LNSGGKPLWALLLPAGLIVAAGLWIYAPALRGGWVWDDVAEVTQNPVLRDPAGLAKIWFAPAGADYFPLKTTVQWLEWRAWGDDPAGDHAVSIALHLLSALLFWRVLRQLGLPLAWVGGLLFAVHPLAVESVAWIAELKNTLSLPFLLLATSAYLEFDKKGSGLGNCFPPSSGKQFPRPDPFYWLSLLWFLLAMLCKSSVVMFPLVILLHAWWKRARIDGRDLRASAPFFAVSLVLGLVTLSFQSHRALASWTIPWEGPGSRLAVAGSNLAFYFGKSLWPAGLLPIYPQWNAAPPALLRFAPWAVLAVLVGWLWSRRATGGRHVLFGLGFFILNLLPVLGFVPMAYFHIAWAADHLAYLPLLGLIGLAAAALGRWPRAAAWVGLTAIAAAMAGQSHRLVPVFHDEETLWTATLAGNPSAWLADNNLGNFLEAKGDSAGAISHFAAAVRLNPDYAEAHYDWGLALARAGRLPEAISHYEKAVRLSPGSAEMHAKLGNAFLNLGHPAEAAGEYRVALRLEPASAEAEGNLGVALAQLGALAEAIGHDEAALRLDPGYIAGHVNLGNALARSGQTDAAITQYQTAVRLGATGADLYFNLATALLHAGRRAEAIEQYEMELRLRPDDDETRKELAALQAGE